MPAIPLYERKTRTPLQGVESGVRVGVFDNSIGRELSQAGQVLTREALEYKLQQDQAEAKRIDTEIGDGITNRLNALLTQRGEDAVRDAPAARADIDRMVEEAVGKASNPVQRQMLADVAARRRSQALGQIADYERVQGTEFALNSSAARVESATREGAVLVRTGREAEFWRMFEPGGTIYSEYVTQERITGAGAEVMTASLAKARSAAAGATAQMLATNDPVAALAFLERNASQMDPIDHAEVKSRIEPVAWQAEAYNALSGVTGTVDGLTSQSVGALVQQIIPGARITGYARTPQRNAEVGGAPASYHLVDQAIDMAPVEGMSVQEVAARLSAQGVRVIEAIDEGDHYHIAFDRRGVSAMATLEQRRAWVEGWAAGDPRKRQVGMAVMGQITSSERAIENEREEAVLDRVYSYMLQGQTPPPELVSQLPARTQLQLMNQGGDDDIPAATSALNWNAAMEGLTSADPAIRAAAQQFWTPEVIASSMRPSEAKDALAARRGEIDMLEPTMRTAERIGAVVGFKKDSPEMAAFSNRLYRDMEEWRRTNNNAMPTQEQIEARARVLLRRGSGAGGARTMTGSSSGFGFEFAPGTRLELSIPGEIKSQITRDFRSRYGRDPSGAEIAQTYRDMLETGIAQPTRR